MTLAPSIREFGKSIDDRGRDIPGSKGGGKGGIALCDGDSPSVTLCCVATDSFHQTPVPPLCREEIAGVHFLLGDARRTDQKRKGNE